MTSLTETERIIARVAERALQWSSDRSQLIVDEKSAGQFASNADIEIEKQLRNDILGSFGDTHILGEEMGGELGPNDTGWAIDPIDGTSNFILGLPSWGISIGYLDKGVSVLGAIALPELGLIVSALRGHGLRVNQQPSPTVARVRAVRMMALGENDYESGSQTDMRAQTLREQGYDVVRYRCAVFSLASAALGRLSGYVENGCGLWDIAAATVICEEAGMVTQTSKIATGRYHIDARWRNPDNDGGS